MCEKFFVNNMGVKMHVLENGVPSEETPSLLIIGGLWSRQSVLFQYFRPFYGVHSPTSKDGGGNAILC